MIGNILFWLFCLVMNLSIPATMFFFGRKFLVDPPKTINGGYGYRTSRSMKNQQTWDFAQVRAGGVITRKVADEALTALEIDYLGLDSIDHRMLRSIIDNYRGGPVGLETLAATINEEAVTLEDVYEPYLMQLGFLTRTPRGRCVTPKAYQHLGLSVPGAAGEMDQQSF